MTAAQPALPLRPSSLSSPRFAEWVRRHPEIVQRFILYALVERRAGRRIGAKAIAEQLRYAPDLRRQYGDEWRIDNSQVAPLARLAEERVPELRGYFRHRASGKEQR